MAGLFVADYRLITKRVMDENNMNPGAAPMEGEEKKEGMEGAAPMENQEGGESTGE